MRTKAWVATVMLLLAAGCGGGDDAGGSGNATGDGNRDAPRGSDAPRDASVEDFCAAFEATSGFISGDEIADILVATGTPADIPEDARRGFEYLIDHPEGGENVINNEDVATYVTYGSTTCADFIEG